MELLLRREPSRDGATCGELLRDGQFECWTLEDAVRDEKLDGATAIQAGRYHVVLTYSKRFKRSLPLLEAVPGFAGIRIHAGNTTEDTSGCILVGRSRFDQTIIDSKQALDRLNGAIAEAILLRHEPVWITIRDADTSFASFHSSVHA